MSDYRDILNYCAAIRASPSAEEYNEEGYVVLRRCVVQAQTLSSQPFQPQNGSKPDMELNKAHLQKWVSDMQRRGKKKERDFIP